jgi:hypothetical protein
VDEDDVGGGQKGGDPSHHLGPDVGLVDAQVKWIDHGTSSRIWASAISPQHNGALPKTSRRRTRQEARKRTAKGGRALRLPRLRCVESRLSDQSHEIVCSLDSQRQPGARTEDSARSAPYSLIQSVVRS